MEQDRVQRYVKTLEKTIQNNHHQLKESIEDFQEMCRMVSPEKHIPAGIAVDIREMYKEIQSRLKEIKAIEQLLQGKYRQYYHRDSLLSKEIMEFGFIAKNCYTKFEYTMVQIESIKRLKEHAPKVDHPAEHLQWFHSKENQVAFIKNLNPLMELDYEPPPEEIGEERRDTAGSRTFTLFLFSGDSLSLDQLQSQIQFREHDTIERYSPEEIRGVLAHLKKVDPIEVEKKFQQVMESQGLTELKCLLLPIHSSKDLKRDLLKLIKTALHEMTQGELRTLSV
jgi:DNA repair exonuclease SbcCD ATPase subunit